MNSYGSDSSGSQLTTGDQPVSWTVVARNIGPATSDSFQTMVVCQSPITVAGVSVPQFGSLYTAIALAAVLYFALTALRQRRTPAISGSAPK